MHLWDVFILGWLKWRRPLVEEVMWCSLQHSRIQETFGNQMFTCILPCPAELLPRFQTEVIVSVCAHGSAAFKRDQIRFRYLCKLNKRVYFYIFYFYIFWRQRKLNIRLFLAWFNWVLMELQMTLKVTLGWTIGRQGPSPYSQMGMLAMTLCPVTLSPKPQQLWRHKISWSQLPPQCEILLNCSRRPQRYLTQGQ